MYKRILVPTDGSEPSRRALTTAIALARQDSARVRLLNVFDPMVCLTGYEVSASVIEDARRSAERLLQDERRAVDEAGVPCEVQCCDAIGTRLGQAVADDATKWDADLVVIGSHGRHGLGRLLLGSGAEEILRLAPVPTLLVR
ncbi:universal stress protein [Ramlibacter algicola]|uniref:Universal stress protein n=1 Tax=Ramlibacter algicola TaxID=2795217 RepID=A0A934Q119_9BURK|nr:universal stress protein [Ramlibacter algicola]